MKEIKCPKCGESFTVDEAGYAAILQQVRTEEFDSELHKRLEAEKKHLEEKHSAEKALEIGQAVSEKEAEISELTHRIETLRMKMEDGEAEKQNEIDRLTDENRHLEEKHAAEKELEINKAVSDKDIEINDLKHEIENLKLKISDGEAEKQNEIDRLTDENRHLEEKHAAEKELEINKAVSDKDIEINDLKHEIEALNKRLSDSDVSRDNAVKTALSDADREYREELKKLDETINGKEREILELKNSLRLREQQSETAIIKAVSEKDSEIEKLKASIQTKETENKLKVAEAVGAVREELNRKEAEYSAELKMKDDQIAYYKDLKAKMSTKMVGETLEQHCRIEFDRIRTAAFPNAYFEKDNDARSGSKGDFIFREDDGNGTEILSIMFEMKNEADGTATKHKNEDFFRELDKDRNEKKCEYAVLVSLLEADNDLYNNGIVDVSYRYPKMYVIRPQFFIPMITLLRGAAMNALKYKQEAALIRAQNIDVTNFESKLQNFKDDFTYNCDLALKQYTKAIDEIDATIKHLEKVKEALTASGKNLRIANNKVDDVTIKKLTWKNPTMKAMFEEAKNSGEE